MNKKTRIKVIQKLVDFGCGFTLSEGLMLAYNKIKIDAVSSALQDINLISQAVEIIPIEKQLIVSTLIGLASMTIGAEMIHKTKDNGREK